MELSSQPDQESLDPADIVAREFSKELAIASDQIERGLKLVREVEQDIATAQKNLGQQPALDMVAAQAAILIARIFEKPIGELPRQ